MEKLKSDRQPYYFNSAEKHIPETRATQLLEKSDSLSFHSSLKNYDPTPVVELKGLAGELGIKNIFLKDESQRFGLNAFKGLGASYAIFRMIEQEPEVETFCTATDGNHGRAVAWAARLFRKKAVVFVPKETTAARIEAIRNEGATVEQLALNYDGTCKYAAQQSREQCWKLVQDTAWENYEEIPGLIKAGYLTHFRELENSIHSLPKAEVDVVFLQAGVGSWPAAAVWYYRNRYKENAPKLILVEPRESSGILQSFKKGVRCEPDGELNSIMAGLNCGIPSLSAWEILKSGIDAAMEVEDTFAEKAMRKLYFPAAGDQQVIGGESGVGGLAGLLALATDSRFADLKHALGVNSKSKILIYNTEGDTDPANFRRIVNANQ